MKNKGLTLSVIFEAESGNYGEGFGNISTLKKLTRGDGNTYTYISRQALRYNIVNQLAWDNTIVYKEGKEEKSVIQFAPNAKIDEYPEIDLFGYMKTSKKKEDSAKGGAATRNAVARLSNAISLEPFKADMDFLTNMGLAKRENFENDISQSEIHKSFYSYTLTIDLDRVGIDVNDDIEISSVEKSNRIQNLLMTLKTLYRDIKGRRENLSPILVVGGVYDVKNPFFENRLHIQKNNLNIDMVKDAMEMAGENTNCGYLKGTFSNNDEIIKELAPNSIKSFFDQICQEAADYYA
jgi:CRISPR-associated protein Cst2